MATPEPLRTRGVEAVLGVAVLLDAAYWTLWAFARDAVASSHRLAYEEFENAFPLADLWLAVACLAALVALRTKHPTALLWLLAGGGAGLYLGCMDLLYDLEHGIFTSGSGGAFELLIVAVTWAFSLTLLRWSWRHRAALLERRPA